MKHMEFRILRMIRGVDNICSLFAATVVMSSGRKYCRFDMLSETYFSTALARFAVMALRQSSVLALAWPRMDQVPSKRTA